MLFWVVAALLTLGASLSVLLPLSTRRASGPADAEHDLEVYRDQLAEIERDTKRGLIPPVEAEQARAEIARRALKADKAAKSTIAPGSTESRFVRSVGAAAVLAVPLVSWGIYAATGSPDLPSQPLSARLDKNPADSTVEELIARAETHLAANPDDPKGWEVLAPIYVRTGRYPDAVTAYRNVIRLDGATAMREAGLGEAIAGAAGGTITAEAQDALSRALELDPDEPKARFLLASAYAQEGRVGEAAEAWGRMLASLPENSPWRTPLQRAIAGAQRELAGLGVAEAPGPTQDDIEAASGMSDEDRSAMIESMVASLDARLKENPRDLDGWMRLVRSYAVLGRSEQAQDALARGVEALGSASAEARQLTDFSSGLGLSMAE